MGFDDDLMGFDGIMGLAQNYGTNDPQFNDKV